MLQFICPKCRKVLRVAPKHLGQKGNCNSCGARIALIGSPSDPAPQAASIVEEGTPEVSDEPATEAQKDYLLRLGARESEVGDLDKATASRRIDELKEEHQKQTPPTEKQLAHLERLGAPPQRIAKVLSQSDASALIEAMHLRPTPIQIELLHTLGATGAQIARLKTKADASELVEELGG